MAALWNRAGHHIFVLWFFLSIFHLSFFLFSTPNLSRRRLDVYHTTTHGVALVRISDAGLKRAARGSMKYRTQKIAKNAASRQHRTTLSRYIFATKARIDNRKKRVKQQYLPHMPLQYGELHPHSSFWATVCYRYVVCLSVLSVCLSVTFVHCGQTVGRIKTNLGMQVSLSPGHIVLDGDPAPLPQGGHTPPISGPYLLRPNGCMDQDITWYGARPRPRRLCVRWGPAPPSPKGGQSPTSKFSARVYCGQTA